MPCYIYWSTYLVRGLEHGPCRYGGTCRPAGQLLCSEAGQLLCSEAAWPIDDADDDMTCS